MSAENVDLSAIVPTTLPVIAARAFSPATRSRVPRRSCASGSARPARAPSRVRRRSASTLPGGSPPCSRRTCSAMVSAALRPRPAGATNCG